MGVMVEAFLKSLDEQCKMANDMVRNLRETLQQNMDDLRKIGLSCNNEAIEVLTHLQEFREEFFTALQRDEGVIEEDDVGPKRHKTDEEDEADEKHLKKKK